MKSVFLIMIGLSSAALLTSTSYAGEGEGKKGKDRAAAFEVIDTNKDGSLSYAEMNAHRALPQKRFDQIDADDNSLVSKEELAKAQASKKGGKGGKGKDKGPKAEASESSDDSDE